MASFDQIEHRYSNPSSEEEKDECFLSLLGLRSRILWIFTKFMENSTDPENYTPDRGNQLMIAQMLKHYDPKTKAQRDKMEYFLPKFY